jgi:phosphoribosyl 1,2-cyclic phosphate phosphodiesterase
LDILFCGTAAAEGWPALFCACAACQGARADTNGGKNLRSRAAYMLGERVRIDFGPDSNLHQQRYGLAYERVEHLLVTHSHDDHWFPRDLAYRRRGFSVVPDWPLHVWGNGRVAAKFVAQNGPWEPYNIVFHRLAPWQPIDLGEGLTATPVLAAHDRSEQCLNFRLELNGRAALLAHDTGFYDEPTWEFLAGRPLDLLVLDCTHGTHDQPTNHLGGAALLRFRDELARRGALAAGAQVLATHFSHNGGALHDELERFFTPHGVSVAYDGLRITL